MLEPVEIQARRSTTFDNIFNAPKYVEQRVGNVTISTKKAIKAASPMNPINAALRSMKGAINTFYGTTTALTPLIIQYSYSILHAESTDNSDGDKSSSELFRAEELYPQNARRARGPREDSGLKDRIYGSVDAVAQVIGGAVYALQAVPILVEGVIKLPETLSNVKKESEDKFVELQEGVDSAKESIDGWYYFR